MSTIPPANRKDLPAPPNGTVGVSGHDAREEVGSFGVAGPQLSDLGKRIEMLRVDRGVSKQVLARAAGTSRQQLWRVMTGKSELTTTLCQRLASVLDVDSRTLSSAPFDGHHHSRSTLALAPGRLRFDIVPARSLAAYLESSTLLVRTLRTLPVGEDGIALKCA